MFPLEDKVANKHPSVTEETLSDWEKQSLFAKHRNNSIFTGAFGKTKAQAKIEDLIWEWRFNP
jgi:hypothetical protein